MNTVSFDEAHPAEAEEAYYANIAEEEEEEREVGTSTNSRASRLPKLPVTGVKPLTLDHADLKQIKRSYSGEEWLIEGLIERDSVVFIAGDSGSGKSPFLYQLGIAVASG